MRPPTVRTRASIDDVQLGANAGTQHALLPQQQTERREDELPELPQHARRHRREPARGPALPGSVGRVDGRRAGGPEGVLLQLPRRPAAADHLRDRPLGRCGAGKQRRDHDDRYRDRLRHQRPRRRRLRRPRQRLPAAGHGVLGRRRPRLQRVPRPARVRQRLRAEIGREFGRRPEDGVGSARLPDPGGQHHARLRRSATTRGSSARRATSSSRRRTTRSRTPTRRG